MYVLRPHVCTCALLCSGTEWASYNLGLFLCELCAQVHRSLGSHISKVKSLRLDKWDAAQIEVDTDATVET